MNDYEISRIVKAEYYGNQQLSKQYATTLKRVESHIQSRSFSYKEPVTRSYKSRNLSMSFRLFQ